MLGSHLIGAAFTGALKLSAFRLSYIADLALENRFKIIYIYDFDYIYILYYIYYNIIYILYYIYI